MNLVTPSRRRHGFTLVEIMTVVLIVGVLSALALFLVGRIKDRAIRSSIQNNLRQLFQAKAFYFAETGSYQPATVRELAKQGYLRPRVSESLLNAHSYEASAGWHYLTTVVPDAPTAAYRGSNPPSSATAAEDIIYYPARPTDLSAYFAATVDLAPGWARLPSGAKTGSAALAPWVAGTTARFPAVREDSPRTFTSEELLKLIGAGAADPNDPAAVTGVTVDPKVGTMTQNPDGSWTFTPAADFHGQNLDLSVKVANKAGENTASATLDVTPVVDPASPSIAMTGQQHVLTFGQDGTGAVMNQGTLNTGGAMSQLAAEFTVIGGPQVATQGFHGATFMSYATASSPDEFYVWNPADLTVRVHGQEYSTGINTQADSDSHRYTVLWDGATGNLQVLKDGVVAKTITGVAQGYQIPGDGKLVLAQDQDRFGGGFDPNDAFHGQILGASMARTLPDPAQLASAPLGTAMQGQSGLVIDIGAQGGTFVDHTGRHQLQQQGAISSQVQQVDTAVSTVRPGATLNMNLNAGAPADRTDRVTGMTMSGLPAGTVLNDGHGHSQTVTGPGQAINLNGWSTGTISAQIAGTATGSHRVTVSVTTTGPNGDQTSTAQETQISIANR